MNEYTWRLHVPIHIDDDPDAYDQRRVAVLVAEIDLPFPYQDGSAGIEVPGRNGFCLTVAPTTAIWKPEERRFDVYCEPELFDDDEQASAFVTAAILSGTWEIDADEDDDEESSLSSSRLSVVD